MDELATALKRLDAQTSLHEHEWSNWSEIETYATIRFADARAGCSTQLWARICELCDKIDKLHIKSGGEVEVW